LINFKLNGIQFRIHFTFLLFNALIFLSKDNGTVSIFYAACILHEAGHILAALISKRKITSVDFMGSGICMKLKKNAASPIKRELFVLLSGPFANILTYAICATANLSNELKLINLMLAVYNLLPYKQLDGGSAIGLFTLGTSSERTAETVLTAIKLGISAFIFMLFILVDRQLFPLFLISVILFANDRTKF
jgi:hypothetical protein rflaF_18991